MRNWIKHLLIISIAIICSVIYLYTAAPFMLFEDAPRLLAAIVSLGIAQPAEPVYVFLAHWFIYLPFGSTVFRIQVFSALLAGGSLLLLYSIVTYILRNISEKRPHSKNNSFLLLAGIFSMIALAFSYQFWSQAQNVETYILDCFLELILLNLLFRIEQGRTGFRLTLIVVIICGLALGTSPPVIASIFPSVFLVIWRHRSYLSKKKLLFLCLTGIIGVIVAWSYLPAAASGNPLLSDVNGSSLQDIWNVATGQHLNINRPDIDLVNGFTWSPTVIATSAWHYVVMAWMDFTPEVLIFTIIGAVYLWRRLRRIFTLLSLIAITNFVLSCLYRSGNQESWYLQSHVVLAICAGVGWVWILECISRLHWPTPSIQIAETILLTVAFVPLIYWWPTLDRHGWSFTQDYMDNLYRPIVPPAIIIGSGDLWEATTSYAYITDYKPGVIPIWLDGLTDPWVRRHLTATTKLSIPDISHYSQSIEGFHLFMNDFLAQNVPKFHIYLSRSAIQDIQISERRDIRSLSVDPNRFNIIPDGLLQEVLPKSANTSALSLGSIDFTWHNGFPRRQPTFLDRSYTNELQFVVFEIAMSYDEAAQFLMIQGKYDEAGAMYQKAYALTPHNPQVLGDLGIYYTQQNQPSKALEYFTQAYAAAPDNITWLYNIGEAQIQLGRTEEAKHNLKRIADNSNVNTPLKQSINKQLKDLDGISSSSEANLRPTPSVIPPNWKQFTSTTMNLTFLYPRTLEIHQVKPQIVQVSDSASTKGLLIYSGHISTSDPKNLWIPFRLPGKLQESHPFHHPRFEGSLDTYGNATESVYVLLLKQSHQLVALYYTDQQALEKQVLDELVQSIAPLDSKDN